MITLSEIKNIYDYEKGREEFRRSVIEAKRDRRISVGPSMSFVFENRTTVLFQIQEMVRIERIVNEDAVQHEIDTYNKLLPTDHELSATMLVEITDKEKIRPTLDSLVGLNTDSVFLVINLKEIPAIFDESQTSEDRISAVQYIRWRLVDEDIAALRSGTADVSLMVRHQNYHHFTKLSDSQVSALVNDLSSSN